MRRRLVCDAYLLGGSCAFEWSAACRRLQSSRRPTAPLELEKKRCQELERNGYLVIDNFLTKEQVKNAVMSLEDDKVFAPSQNEQNGDKVHTDIFFNGGNQIGEEKEGKNQEKALNARRAKYSLSLGIHTIL